MLRPAFAALACFALSVVLAGCTGRFFVRGDGSSRYDAVIVPGCPSELDGSLSRCQEARAVWATILWRRQVASAFIVSGAAVHSRYIEAVALAQAMATLGVPAERIWLEPNALHTDENMYYSLRIARALGFATLAVASQSGHAGFSCLMLEDWGAPCRALAVDMKAVIALDALPQLERVRTTAALDYRPIDERERALAAARHRKRPASFLLYAYMAWWRLLHRPWIPSPPPAGQPLMTFADWQQLPR